jgi:tetratricopeptide (TPR) repeat protein
MNKEGDLMNSKTLRTVCSLIFSLFFLLPVGLFAQENFPIAYVDGPAEVAAGAGWNRLEPGDTVTPEDRVRIGRQGIIEITIKTGSLTLNRPGTYLIGDLVSQAMSVSSWNLGNLVANKLKTAVNPKRSRSSAVMGVRAEAVEKAPVVQWMVDELDPVLEQGKAHFDSGSYQDAVLVLEKGLPAAESDHVPAYRYYLASAYAEMGKNGPALKHIGAAVVDSTEEFYNEFVLLKGRLLIEGTSFRDALTLFEEYLKTDDRGPSAQAVLILASYCHLGLAGPADARKALQRAIDMDPSSELAGEAEALLKKL